MWPKKVNSYFAFAENRGKQIIRAESFVDGPNRGKIEQFKAKIIIGSLHIDYVIRVVIARTKQLPGDRRLVYFIANVLFKISIITALN